METQVPDAEKILWGERCDMQSFPNLLISYQWWIYVCRAFTCAAFFIIFFGGRTSVIGIVVEAEESVDALNDILHEYRSFIIGRMGIPYRQKQLNIISIAVDAPQDIISALSGKVGKLPGVSSKTAYSAINAWVI